MRRLNVRNLRISLNALNVADVLLYVRCYDVQLYLARAKYLRLLMSC